MTKVQILIPGLSGGGAEYVARCWASGLSHAGYDVEAVLTHRGSESSEIPGVQITTIGAKHGFLGAIWSYRSHLLASRPLVVLSLMPYSNLVALLASILMNRQARPRVVISEHTLHAGRRKAMDRNFRIQLQIARFAYSRANACIAVSHAVGAELCAMFRVSRERLWVIPNPVADETGVNNPRRARVSEMASLTVVVPARLVAAKRPQIALLVASIVQERTGKPTAVAFFGDGPMRQDLAELALRMGVSADFHGWVDKWYDAVPSDGIVFLPSAVEGFGNVLVEATARSVPTVVSSRAFGAADACIPGVTGVLSAGDSPAEYATAVISAAELDVGDVGGWLNRFTNEEVLRSLRPVLHGRSGNRDDMDSRTGAKIGRKNHVE